jgi:hypothetical protein
MPHSPYREPFKLETSIQVQVESEVAEFLKVMSQHTKIPEGEIVNTALRRFISAHNDYFPREYFRNKRQAGAK